MAAVLLALTVSSTPAPGVSALQPPAVSSTGEALRLGAVAASDYIPGPTPAADAPDLRVPQPAPAATPAPTPRPAPTARPAAAKAVRAAARPAAMWAQLRRGLTVTGRATWYGATRGYAGVPHVAMPGARYLPRGRNAPRARVCVDGRCVIVLVVDACGCSVGTPRARIVDLSAAALERLRLDPGRGVYRVRVTLVTS